MDTSSSSSLELAVTVNGTRLSNAHVTVMCMSLDYFFDALSSGTLGSDETARRLTERHKAGIQEMLALMSIDVVRPLKQG